MFFDDESSSGASLFAQLLAGMMQQQQRQEQGRNNKMLLFKAAIEGNGSMCQRLVASGVDPDVQHEKGLRPLHLAAHQGHEKTVAALLDAGANADVTDEDGDTPLMVAIMQKEWQTARLLIERNAELRLKNNNGYTAADLALAKGNLGLVKMMERKRPALQLNGRINGSQLLQAAQDGNDDLIGFWLDQNPDRSACNVQLKDGRTLAFVAALNGHLDIIERLERCRADYNIADSEGNIPLFCAAQNGHDKILKILIKRSRVNHRNENKRTALFSAVLNGRETAMKMLLDAGADTDAADCQGLTPLACSIVSNNPDRIVRLLASRTKDLSFVDKNGYGYAHLAVISQRLPVLKTLRSHGIILDTPNTGDGETPLLAACQVGPLETVEYLLKEGCNSGHQNNHGVSPALRAAYCNQEDILRHLVNHGAPLDLKNRKGETAILCAAEKNSFSMVQLLHRRGCNLRVADRSGMTVAHYAAKHANHELLGYLDQNGVALDKPDSDGQTPLMMAAGADDMNCTVVRLLVRAGANVDARNNKGKNAAQIANGQGNRHLVHLLQSGGISDQPKNPPPSYPKPPRESSTPRAEIDENFDTWDFFIEEGDKKKPIGSGGFGKVYKAFTDRHQFVAVKVIKPMGNMDSAKRRQIFLQEKQAMDLLRHVRHENIVRFLKAEEKDGKFYIFSELLSGYTIQEIMFKQKKPIDESGIKRFTIQVCQALSHLHSLPKPIIHRDIKSSNIMLTNPGIVKLIDFGFAREISNSQMMMTRTQCGTPFFMAPEILAPMNEGVAYTSKTDVWALGCTVYEMATMEPPNSEIQALFFLGIVVSSKPMPKIPGASAELQDFYQLCVEREPSNRPEASRLLQHKFLK
ncbi:hypothetical protein BOX15_Mlig023526g1 [Macrostomum lignano]|uniref:Uncharacterized protein n=2 Tax=Macrostomum lignano TaxID=282301 RepID=A0A267FVE8_9PLAT|nr:hypothetical protein BOX15_Mlig023526g1 [Macrostomum lignano]